MPISARLWLIRARLSAVVSVQSARVQKHVSEVQKRVGNASLFDSVCMCHAQSLAATNRVTEQFGWRLTVESSYLSCLISWMASLIDNLYLLDLIMWVINWQYVSSLRGTIRGNPHQETLYSVRSPILFVRLVMFMCKHNEAERSVCVNIPAPRGGAVWDPVKDQWHY